MKTCQPPPPFPLWNKIADDSAWNILGWDLLKLTMNEPHVKKANLRWGDKFCISKLKHFQESLEKAS